MSECMDPPGPRSGRGLEMREVPLIVGWQMHAAFGHQLVTLHTDAGSECFAITSGRAADLLHELGMLLDRQIEDVLTGKLGALH